MPLGSSIFCPLKPWKPKGKDDQVFQGWNDVAMDRAMVLSEFWHVKVNSSSSHCCCQPFEQPLKIEGQDILFLQ